MTTTHGKGGIVKLGANTVGEVKSFEITETAEVADDSAMGDAARTHQVGLADWSASMSTHWDPGDTTGQEALTVGASVTFNTFPQGDTTGDRTGTGTATVVSVGVPVALDDIIARDIELKGNGAFTWSDVP